MMQRRCTLESSRSVPVIDRLTDWSLSIGGAEFTVTNRLLRHAAVTTVDTRLCALRVALRRSVQQRSRMALDLEHLLLLLHRRHDRWCLRVVIHRLRMHQHRQRRHHRLSWKQRSFSNSQVIMRKALSHPTGSTMNVSNYSTTYISFSHQSGHF